MKKLAFTTAIALALATAAYGADKGGRGPNMGGGGGPGPSMSAGPGPGSGAPSNFSAGRATMAPSKGPSGRLYNQAPSNGPNFDKGRYGDRDRDRFSDRDRDHDRHLFNRADRDHDFDRDRHGLDRDHHGVVSGNFFEHGRHFRFRRFFHGEWVFLSDWDDCTAWAWVHIAPGTWAWRPVDICVG